MVTDLSDVPNPFNFSSPVRSQELFAGRREEMSDVRYYLDQAVLQEMPVNLALVGERASGKTSFLNIIEIEARTRDICVARLELDEGDAVSELAFFRKIFDSLFTAACLQGAYEGLNGKTYENYREMVDAYSIPTEKLFCPFAFPLQLAKALGGGNPTAAVSSEAFKHDIRLIQKEVGGTIALLFDEGNVLAGSKVLLEKLRNIFMNVPGIMLTITGTQALFPIMDEVFSPIVRGFKKIDVKPFDPEDTENCIRAALMTIEKGGRVQTAEWIEKLDLDAVHTLSGGRPYEIQLVCHFMFRRMQEGKTKSFELSTAVLDDVRRELEKTQDVTARPVLTAMAAYTERQYAALGRFTQGSDRLSFEQAWFLTELFDDEAAWTEDDLRTHLATFLDDGVLQIDEGTISFAGDEFDRVYAKYLARQRDAALEFNEMPLVIALAFGLYSYLTVNENIGNWLSLFMKREDDLATISAAFGEDMVGDPFDSTPTAAARVYRQSFLLREQGFFRIAHVTVKTPWDTFHYDFDEAPVDDGDFTQTMESGVSRLAERASNHSAAVELELEEVRAVSPDVLTTHLERTANSAVRRELGDWHGGLMSSAFLSEGDKEEATFHAAHAARFGGPSTATNAGYVFLAAVELDSARRPLEMAIKEGDKETRALASYNLGILEAKEGNKKEAVRLIEVASQLASHPHPLLCLLIPRVGESSAIDFEEVMNPDLSDAASQALDVLGGS